MSISIAVHTVVGVTVTPFHSTNLNRETACVHIQSGSRIDNRKQGLDVYFDTPEAAEAFADGLRRAIAIDRQDAISRLPEIPK